MFRRLAAGLLLRRLARDLTQIAALLDRQNAILARLADHFVPLPSTPASAELRAETGVSHLAADDAALALAYVARTQAQTGHTPDDEEIAIHLDDERTRDLTERLTQREAQLGRLAESRL